MSTRGILLLAAIALPLPADTILFHGKVVMEDGTAPGRRVGIVRLCPGLYPSHETSTGLKGEYYWRVEADPFQGLIFNTGGWIAGLGPASVDCVLRAELSGYASSEIDLSDRNLIRNPQLPNLILARRTLTTIDIPPADQVPHAAAKDWAAAVQALRGKNWAQAESRLRGVVQAAPKFAPAWSALGMVCQRQEKPDDARTAYQHAIELAPKTLAPYPPLVRAQMDLQDWASAAKTADALIRADTPHRYPEIYADLAVIRFHLNDQKGAEESARQALREDPRHERPRTEYILGMILEGAKDYTGAAEHMRKYLELEPKAEDAEAVRRRIDNLGKETSTAVVAELDAGQAQLPPGGETSVPGGIQAFAAAAFLDKPVSYANFFLELCRALRGTPLRDNQSIPNYLERLEAYMASVAEMAALGQTHGDAATVTLSLASDAERRKTAHVLWLLGWNLAQGAVEPGDQHDDGLRQEVPRALGIDEIAMRDALEAGRSFQFEVRSENARLVGGIGWSTLLAKGAAPFTGGMAEVFTRDPRFAAAYAGLAAMGSETAAAVVEGVGLRTLVTQYADLLARNAEAFAVSGGRVATPGGPPSDAAWTRLVGADPKKPPAIFRALIEKDRGALLPFYSALSQADATHQRFFTRTAADAERFYAWYRAPGHTSWRDSALLKLPLEAAGTVRYPGGKRAWTDSFAPDGEELPTLTTLEALVPVARLEEERHAPLDAASARLLAQHYGEWRSLFPYFTALPGLGGAEFQALEAFSKAAAGYSEERRETVIGDWQSLVKLVVLGAQAGSLDAPAAARAFRDICTGLMATDYSAKAIEALRAIAGTGVDLDDAVATGLLRLAGERRANFERVRDLQRAPRLASLAGSPDPRLTLAALSGLVYAAVLDPDGVLVSLDPLLLGKHRFAWAAEERRPRLFAGFGLVPSAAPPGSYFAGGFAGFEARALSLGRAARLPGSHPLAFAPPVKAAPPGPVETLPLGPTEAVFRTDSRLVEVYVTVSDDRGRYVDDLPPTQFALREQGTTVPIAAFETRTSPVSVALLLDTTGSMEAALPALKNAALKLIDELRPIDSVAVYGFNESVSLLHPFTNDRRAAERAVLKTQAFGGTALYDALVRVDRDLSVRPGKKVIVVFTDGDDNASTLTAETAILCVKTDGVPVYTIAQGEAVKHPQFVTQLAAVSRATGGVAFTIQAPSEIRRVFESVSQDLMHGYLLMFQPPASASTGWRTIEVGLADSRGRKVRAREGYYAD